MARRQDKEKRKRILNAAYATFGEMGYRNSTIKDIAQKADVAAGSIYTYFVDKEELFRATFEDGWNKFIKEINNSSARLGTYNQKLESLIEIGFRHLKYAHPLLRGMFSEANRMQLFQSNVDLLVNGILDIFHENDAVWFSTTQSREERNFFIKIIVSGILFDAALTPPEKLDEEIARMKDGIVKGFFFQGRTVP